MAVYGIAGEGDLRLVHQPEDDIPPEHAAQPGQRKDDGALLGLRSGVHRDLGAHP